MIKCQEEEKKEKKERENQHYAVKRLGNNNRYHISLEIYSSVRTSILLCLKYDTSLKPSS